jgi:hypothetical protein
LHSGTLDSPAALHWRVIVNNEITAKIKKRKTQKYEQLNTK